MFTGKLTSDRMNEILKEWPENPREVAQKITKKYGPPDEATDSLLIWYENGPWKRSIIYRNEVPHDFPKPHTDLLEQTIDYKVPPEKFDDLARFDGSVIVERTKGEISARCDAEAANFLALNLSHDIITGKRTIEDAREFYAEKIKGRMKGESDPYIESLQFQVPKQDTMDPDETVIKEMK